MTDKSLFPQSNAGLSKAVELAEIRVENILEPYSSVLTPAIVAERLVAAVVEEVLHYGS